MTQKSAEENLEKFGYHIVELSNGQKMTIREGNNEVTIGNLDEGEPWQICQINFDGVLVYPNSGDGCETLVDGLKEI